MSGFVMEIEDDTTDAPERIAILGEAGIGKSTLAAGAPRPFFIDLERGSGRIRHIGRNKRAINAWGDIYSVIEWLRTAQHPYKTAVLDTLDRAEWLCWKYLCERDGVQSIDQVAKGYGRGYNAAYEEFRNLFAAFERLCEERSMHVIFIAHQKNEKVRNVGALGADYERFGFKVHSAIGGIMYEACDHVLFCMRNTVVTDDLHDDGRPRAIGGNKRIIHTVGNPAYVAKTRATVPDPMPLSWHDWVCHLAVSKPVPFPRLLKETVRDNARRLGDPEIEKGVESMLAASGPIDVQKFARANAKLIRMLGVPTDAEDTTTPPQEGEKKEGEKKDEGKKTEGAAEPAA